MADGLDESIHTRTSRVDGTGLPRQADTDTRSRTPTHARRHTGRQTPEDIHSVIRPMCRASFSFTYLWASRMLPPKASALASRAFLPRGEVLRKDMLVVSRRHTPDRAAFTSLRVLCTCEVSEKKAVREVRQRVRARVPVAGGRGEARRRDASLVVRYNRGRKTKPCTQ